MRLARPIVLICAGVVTLAGCNRPMDWDLRGGAGGFDTSAAAAAATAKPAPDANGVINYPNYRVALARRGETPAAVATRLGVNVSELARLNGLDPNSPLREGELLTLPGAGGAASTGVTVSDLPSGTEPLKHQVKPGETAFSVARLYDVPVQSIAQMNNLDSNMTVRPGQQLLIPIAGATTAANTAPGQGSPTPIPPSSTTPLPSSNPTPLAPGAPAASSSASGASSTASAPSTPAPATPQLGTTNASSASARFVLPVSGAIVREYAKGRNDGIDIAAAPGTAVKAADSGTLAAVTPNTNGTKIAVIKHSDGLLTVYLNLGDVSVTRNQSVRKGQTIGTIASGFDSLHFEVRRGLESVDPAPYLP